MKKSILILSALIILIMTACGDEQSTQDLIASGDMAAIRAKKKEFSDQLKSLNSEMALLDSVIALEQGEKNLPLVTTIKATQSRFEHFIELQGDVATKQNVLVYPEAPGILTSVNVTEGQKVSKGQVLARIDDAVLRNQLIQIKTQLALAKTTFERQSRLWEQKIGTEIQYLQTKSNYESQKSAVNQLEQQLDKYVIKAPFTGIIDDVIQERGTVVSPGPGSQVFRIINLSKMYIEVPVPETYIRSIKAGKKVEVFIPVLNKTVESKVEQTSNFINPNNRSFTVQISVPNQDLEIKPNMIAKVLINDYVNESAILVPQSIISENAEGQQYAFLATNINKENEGEAHRSIIETGKTKGDYVEVLSGIDVGEQVIQEGARSVKDGQEVKILKK